MKITLEFEHPCELIDLLEKLVQCYILPAPICEPDYEMSTFECTEEAFNNFGRDELIKECSDETRIYKVEN